MKVVIDSERCQGHGRCFTLAANLFGFDELGSGFVIGDGVLTDATLGLAKLAQSNCPEHAISIEDS